MPKDIVIIALDMNKHDKEFKVYRELSALKKIDLMKNHIEKIYNKFQKQNPDAACVVVWREYGITEGALRSLDKTAKDYLKLIMSQLCERYSNLTIMGGVSTRKKANYSKLAAVREYYKLHSWIKTIDEKESLERREFSLHQDKFTKTLGKKSSPVIDDEKKCNCFLMLSAESAIPKIVSEGTLVIKLEEKQLSFHKISEGILQPSIKSINLSDDDLSKVISHFPGAGEQPKEISNINNKTLFDYIVSLGDTREFKLVRNTMYCFTTDEKTRQVVIKRHDKIAPYKETLPDEFFKPGGKKDKKTNEDKSLSTLFLIADNMIGVEICMEHGKGVLTREIKNNVFVKPLIHLIISDSVPIELKHACGKYVINIDSLDKPQLVLMQDPDSIAEKVQLYSFNVLYSNSELIPIIPTYPFHYQLLDRINKLIIEEKGPTNLKVLASLKQKIEKKCCQNVILKPDIYLELKSYIEAAQRSAMTENRHRFNFLKCVSESDPLEDSMDSLLEFLEKEKLKEEKSSGKSFTPKK